MGSSSRARDATGTFRPRWMTTESGNAGEGDQEVRHMSPHKQQFESAVVAALSALALSGAVASGQSFGPVGILPGGHFVNTRAISANGAFVVGDADGVGFNQHAFRKERFGGILDLGVLPGGQFSR